MAFSFEPFLAISAGHFMAVSAGPEQPEMGKSAFCTRNPAYFPGAVAVRRTPFRSHPRNLNGGTYRV
jgi:hypothetical protein